MQSVSDLDFEGDQPVGKALWFIVLVPEFHLGLGVGVVVEPLGHVEASGAVTGDDQVIFGSFDFCDIGHRAGHQALFAASDFVASLD
ncbi:MAG: Uncharacterised protein [Cellulomonadaceae bacterium TMED98]|nr:MAG: Uncharacterised protein [Cellulomonadaceae bacterium TMED98]